ncbi:MAG: hypothetical protein A2133_02545 [Actinobacteria bacterium RBG_16_64_13]|nr:MAG: hypothetical protein A2133_02545 [Actinobacteria bacterium RBG_16_64_13]
MWSRGLRVVGLVTMAGALATLGVLVGCGARDTTVEPMLPDSAGASAVAAPLASVFSDLAVSVAPMPAYGLAELPLEATIPAEWWPVIEIADPAAYQGPPAGNPRVLDSQGHDPEAQLVIDLQGGWLAILENFRGDLGDTSGVEVGTVAGHRAYLYAVNGGSLIQWSDGGRWYGVFGRDLPTQTVVDVALEMQLVPARGAR